MRTLSTSFILLSAIAFAQATVVTKDGTGEAAVVNKDEAKAFEDAKNAALRSAVEQAAGVRIDADTLAVNNQLVRDQVFANTSGYVKSFDVVSKKVEKGVMTVVVKANVITDNLDKDIQAARDLVKRMGRPSIVIVVQEQTIPIGEKLLINSDVTATVLTEAFKADGWDIKDAQAINKALKVDGAATLGSVAMKEINDLTRANYVLYGRTVLRHQAPDSMLKGADVFHVSGEYDLALAATDSELQIAKVAGKLTWKDPSRPPVLSYERTAFVLVQERKKEIVEGVRKAILEHFRSSATNGIQISMGVSGLEDYGAAKDFKKSIEAIKGVKEAIQDKFDKGKATFRVTFLGNVDDLATEFQQATFKKKKLNVVSATSNTLEVAVAK
ncbi:MAG: flagellar assembly protein T N-terminal domain-containing protein [Myxococcales bacterium]|nr:flagellar assembly protein T N-terminal domain-containing protein [Myxococcales bacterium]MDP3502339.1 flagellar assembly protein T N-terminal domain-containing protein [Myxococcales bacterium]